MRRILCAGRDGDAGRFCDLPIHQTTTKPWPGRKCGLANRSGGHFDFVCPVDIGGAGAGVFHALGHDSDPGDFARRFFWLESCPTICLARGRKRAHGGGPFFTQSRRIGSFFWLADALETGKSTFHWGYVGKAFGYVVGYVGAALCLATLLFEERELS